ncbi:Hypothetical_protein [Hexamita inflata]|uniref:Hypothetical_protein n=1 Tax=Hexamita inflata TaxID=28002 RepID=A0AA86QCJ3_9EUKA|nr:Hypothetical protein HINF_LOCUS38242 [Hexamita inflata]
MFCIAVPKASTKAVPPLGLQIWLSIAPHVFTFLCCQISQFYVLKVSRVILTSCSYFESSETQALNPPIVSLAMPASNRSYPKWQLLLSDLLSLFYEVGGITTLGTQ